MAWYMFNFNETTKTSSSGMLTVYHATIAGSKILQEGFKTSAELAGASLGGSAHKGSISFTTDWQVALGIHEGIILMWEFANSSNSMDMVQQYAQSMPPEVLENIKKSYNEKAFEVAMLGKKIEQSMLQAKTLEELQQEGLEPAPWDEGVEGRYFMWMRPMDQQEWDSFVYDFVKFYLFHHPDIYDPLFFCSDISFFRGVQREDIGILTVKLFIDPAQRSDRGLGRGFDYLEGMAEIQVGDKSLIREIVDFETNPTETPKVTADPVAYHSDPVVEEKLNKILPVLYKHYNLLKLVFPDPSTVIAVLRSSKEAYNLWGTIKMIRDKIDGSFFHEAAKIKRYMKMPPEVETGFHACPQDLQEQLMRIEPSSIDDWIWDVYFEDHDKYDPWYESLKSAGVHNPDNWIRDFMDWRYDYDRYKERFDSEFATAKRWVPFLTEENLLGFDELSQAIREVFPRTASNNQTVKLASREIFFHGTSLSNVSTILSQGLNENHGRVFDEGFRQKDHSIETHGGIYFARNLMTAISSATSSNEKIEGTAVGQGKCVVIAELETKTPHILIDEDSLHGPGFAIGRTFGININGYWLANWAKEGFSDVGKVADEWLKSIQTDFPVNSEQLWMNLKPLLIEMTKAWSMIEIAAYIRDDEWQKHALPEFADLTVEQANAEYMRLANEFSQRAHRLTSFEREQKDYYGTEDNVRSLESINFKGSNKIVAILSIKDGRDYWEEGKERKYHDIIEVLYKNDGFEAGLNEFIRQFEIRVGNHFIVKDKDGNTFYDNPNSEIYSKMARTAGWLIKLQSEWLNRDNLLFHGTGEPIEGDLTTLSHGGILWTAETPDIAQNYIPDSGIKTYYSKAWDLNNRVSPGNDIEVQVARALGAEVDVEYKTFTDDEGKEHPIYHEPLSWTWNVPLENIPTKGDVWKYLTETLGYQPDGNGILKLKISGTTGRDFDIYPAEYKMPGSLFIFTGRDKLKIMDLTDDANDLFDPTYNKIDWFRKAQQDGYDGVRINDYAQSEHYGNMNHVSIGLFPSALEKLKKERVDAVNFDWSPERERNIAGDTNEFNAWYDAKRQQNG